MSQHLGKETTVEIGGKQYTLSRFSRKVLSKFIDWSDTVLPDPLDQIRGKLDGFPTNIQEMLVKDAIERKSLRRSVNSPEIQALMSTPDGAMKILSLLFQTHHPNLTDADVERLYEESALEHGEDYLFNAIVRTAGRMPVDETKLEREYLQEKGLLPSSPEKKG